MVTTITLILWVFLSDGSQTYSTEDAPSVRACLIAAEKYIESDHILEPEGSTFAAGCIVHQQRVS